MKTLIALFAVVLMTFHLACTDKAALQTAPTTRSTANADLFPQALPLTVFDVWTFTAEQTESDCEFKAIGNVVEEEWRIFEEGDGCAISDSTPDGTLLTNYNDLLRMGKTTCTRNGESASLVWSDTLMDVGGGCSAVLTASLPLALSADGNLLEGEMTASFSFTGTCPPAAAEQHCTHHLIVTGERGRLAGAKEADYHTIFTAPPMDESAHAAIMQTLGGGTPPDGTITTVQTRVIFSDGPLDTAVHHALSLRAGAVITREALATLTRLVASDIGVRNLAGIEYATGLRQLYLDKNQITNIATLRTLHQNGGLPDGSTLTLANNPDLRVYTKDNGAAWNAIVEELSEAGVDIDIAD